MSREPSEGPRLESSRDEPVFRRDLRAAEARNADWLTGSEKMCREGLESSSDRTSASRATSTASAVATTIRADLSATQSTRTASKVPPEQALRSLSMPEREDPKGQRPPQRLPSLKEYQPKQVITLLAPKPATGKTTAALDHSPADDFASTLGHSNHRSDHHSATINRRRKSSRNYQSQPELAKRPKLEVKSQSPVNSPREESVKLRLWIQNPREQPHNEKPNESQQLSQKSDSTSLPQLWSSHWVKWYKDTRGI